MMGIFRNKAKSEPRARFWQWFAQNEDRLFHFERAQDAVFGALAAELQKIDPNLCFEFGPANVSREFVVSAGGIKESFPSVVSLMDVAPRLPRWRFTAFRPRRSVLNAIEYNEKRIAPEDVTCTLLVSKTEKKLGLRLFIKGYRNEDMDFKGIGYLMLDEALGEFDVETRLGLIEMMSPDTETDGERIPLSELPEHFDTLVAEIEGRSLKPS
jgi:hypothetical protein